jgi:23S rRNA (guanosine2251-2'-O)-methyltransferase
MTKRKQDRHRPVRGGSGRSQHQPGAHSRPASDPSLIYGRHAVLAALANPRRTVSEIVCAEDMGAVVGDHIAALEAERRSALPVPRILARDELDALIGEAAVHQGVVARVADVALEDLLAGASPHAILVVLDQVTDPHNIGAVLRSAAAFGAEAVIVQDRHTPQAGSVIAKTASGALDVTPIVRVVNLARALRMMQEDGFWCVGLAEEGEALLTELDLGGRVALVLGAEGDGLRRLTRETCDQLVQLPTRAPIRSLNVSAAAAIALHQAAIASNRKVG